MSGTFNKASSYFQKGQYGEVIRLLEPQVFRFRESFDFYFLLGLSCLHTNDIGSAFTYLQRAHDLSARNKEVLLALAIVHMHRGENNEALRSWLHVLEIDPKNRKAQKGLNMLRSNLKKEELLDDLEEGKFNKLLPVRKKASINFIKIVPIFLLIIVLGSLAFFGKFIFHNFSKDKRPDFLPLETSSLEELIELGGGDYYFILTEMEAKDAIQRLNSFFLDYRDNMAMREINLLLLSNINKELQDKIRILEGNISTPNFTNLKDNFTYAEVKSDPYLYRKCYIAWKGRATNIQITDDNIRFDLLAGYDTEKVLDGIVTVFLDFSVDITADFPMEVLAEVIPTTAGDFYLKGVALHRLWD